LTDQHGVKANSDVYIEIAVEKVDLKSLFDPICERFCIPLQNIKGWADINDRAGMMKRFAKWERCGKRCILLLWRGPRPGRTPDLNQHAVEPGRSVAHCRLGTRSTGNRVLWPEGGLHQSDVLT
jgi:hypothetical protein